ncbi:PAS domain S-box protein [Limnoraphis robusta Tam1]|uniref:PAS domain S-box protein n=1 Tax=Limnoraphis robusta TaxID=1118279 RepID=UPI002B1FAFE5|nr:PAS domain S-box protein [Limnoraphis robusta]MEA5537722.1 PAS domain S-box protein [Limnoraphis robusta Tam1]
MVIKRFSQWLTKVSVIPLRTLLIVPVVLQIIGAVGIVGYLSYRSGQNAVEELTNQLMLEIGDKITQSLNNYLHISDEITEINAKLIGLGLLDWQNKSQLEDYFVEQINTFEQVSSVYIATEEKDFLVIAKPQSESLVIRLVIREWNPRTGDLENYVADQQGNRLYLRDTIPNYDPHNDPPTQPWYAIAKSAKNGTWRMVVSGVKKEELILVMVRSLPFYDSQGNLQGVLGATVFLDKMGEFLRQLKIGKTGQTFIVDDQGFFIATSTDELPFHQPYSSPKLETFDPQNLRVSLEDSQNPVTQAVGKFLFSQFSSLDAIHQAVDLRLKHQNQDYYIRVIPYSLDSNSNWFIVVTIPVSDFMGRIKNNVHRTVLLCVAAFALSILIAQLTTKIIIKPINKLNKAAQELAQNHLSLSLEKTRIKEVNQLSHAFEQMADKLRVSFQALKLSEQRFSTLLDSVPIGISVFDKTGQHILINQVGEQILGQGIKTIPAERLSEVYQVYVAGTNQLYPPEKLPEIRALKGNTVHVDDLEIEVNNRRIPLEVTSIPVFDEFRIVRYSIIAFQDITERRKNDKLRLNYQQQLEQEITERTLALQISEERLQLVIDATLDGILDWDIINNTAWLSPQFYKLLGFAVTEIELAPATLFQNLIHPDDRHHFQQILTNHLENNHPYIIELRVQRSDGSYGWFLCKAQALRNKNGEPYRMLGSCSNISDRKQAEELLYQSEARYLSILEYQTEFITRFQPDGTLSFVNDAYCRYFGVSKEDLLGHSYQPIIYPEDQPIIDGCLACLSPQQPVIKIENRVIVNGTVRWTQWTNQAIYDTQGNLVELQSVGRDIDDRKQAEIALQKTNQQLQAFLDNAPAAIHLFDVEERYLRVNRAFANLFNLSEEQIVGKRFADFFTEEVINIFRTRINQLIEIGQPVTVEDELLINGDLKTFESILFPVIDEGGRLREIWAIATDISERKQAEIELRKSRDLRDAIFHESADALFLVDSESLLTIDCNRRAVELFEAKNREELIGIEGHILQKRQFTPQEVQNSREAVDQKGFWDLEIEYLTKQGRSFWGNLAARKIYIDGQLFHLVRVTDISDRKLAEQALRQSEKQLRLLADALPVFISYADSEERYQFVNKKYEEQFGLNREEICGKTTREVIGDINYHLIRGSIEQALMGESVSYEVQFQNLADLGEHYLSVMLIPNFDESFGVQGYYSLIIDISDRKQIELQLQKAKEAAEAASQAKGTFIANMSHELRSPLNAILGFARILKNDSKLSSYQRKNADIIYRSGEHLLNLINQVLDLAKIEANRTTLDLTDFHFDALLDDIYNMFSLKTESQGLNLNIQKASDVPSYICTDEMKLRQVLINLLSNAVKFTKQGSITLRVFVASESSDPVMLNFEVEDTGAGIAPEEQTHLFEAFNQTEAGRKIQHGTGLGLTICREFVQLMGGKISLDSQQNVGSIFRFNIAAKTLKLPSKTSPLKIDKIIGLAPEQPAYRLLVVDDNSANRRLLVQLLTPLGFAVQEAENGAEAITLWQQWQPDLIWMDLRMPVLDGYQATRQIRQQEQFQNVTNSVIIIAISANQLPEDHQTLGFNHFIHKPFEELEIFTALQQHLGVQYRYAESISEQCEKSVNTDGWQTVANLPEHTLKKLEDALILGDPQIIQQTIQSLNNPNNHLAETLTLWADRFEYSRILDLIRSVR